MVKRKSRGRGAKRRCGPKISDKGDIDTNVCCTCNGLYEHDVIEGTGADWLACACGRWLHEDCVEDCIKDDEGKERICLFCLDSFAT